MSGFTSRPAPRGARCGALARNGGQEPPPGTRGRRPAKPSANLGRSSSSHSGWRSSMRCQRINVARHPRRPARVGHVSARRRAEPGRCAVLGASAAVPHPQTGVCELWRTPRCLTAS